MGRVRMRRRNSAIRVSVSDYGRNGERGMSQFPSIFDARQRLISLVLDSLPSDSSKKAYRSSLERFLAWFQASGLSGFTRATVMQY